MMATVCYSREQAPSVSPAVNLEATADFLTSLDGSHSHLSTDNYPPPQPRFVFPADPPSPSSKPQSYNPATRRRRPLSAVETHSRSFSLAVDSADRIPRHAGLPDFSFNPGATLPPDTQGQLFLSPNTFNTPRTMPSVARPGGHGHRRGGSEFVGGRLREGSSIAVFSTTPMKPEADVPPPPSSLQIPPPGRRGHRRGVSGTISTNDLPILAPAPLHNPFSKGNNSAPNSPTGTDPHIAFPPLGPDDAPALINLPEPVLPLEPEKAMSNDIELAPTEDVEPVADKEQKPPKPPVRARVGFSDTLEFIPRPLSLISTDTSSTMTARPGHSVSGSISSIISAVPNGRESPAPLSRVPTSELIDSRPSTAGAILQRASESRSSNGKPISMRRRNSIPALMDVPDADSVSPATPSPTKTNKRWSFFGLESLASSSLPSKGRPGSSSSIESNPRVIYSASCSDHGSDTSADGSEDTSKQKKAKKNSKKNRVKGWAGSILPRKSKSNKKRSKPIRPPTPPASVTHLDDEDDEDMSDKEPREPELMTPPTVTITESEALPKRRSADESAFPMIDLDAALGPFNTPISYNPEWEAAQQAAGNSNKRRLHSAQGMRGFAGPGMHYHRRAESAPALPPFDPGRAFINRFGSNSTMADVFEEDEEDDGKDGSQSKSESEDGSDGEVTPPVAAPVPVDIPVHELPEPLKVARRRGSGLSDRETLGTHSVRTECSRISLQEAVIAEEPPFPPFAEVNMLPGSRGSFESGSPSPRQFPGLSDLPLVDDYSLNHSNTGGIPMSPYTVSSSHPSPRSPISIDAQRISTAPSSVTDANSFHSLLMGEPGPEVRISMDYDIPSLTSSNSTMTRDSTPIPLPRVNRSTLRDQRPVSVSSAAFGRRRSSLVSLSRLISTSHGERSKLSMEVTLENEPPQQQKKPKSKSSRLSRMMQFWKPNKDGATT